MQVQPLNTASLLTSALGSKRRIITNPLLGSSDSSNNDVVTAARNRLQAARDAHEAALQFAAQKTIMNYANRMARQQMKLSQFNVGQPVSPSLPAPKGQVKNWIAEAIRLTPHTGMGLAAGLYNMIMHESGGNPNAINNWDSNAKAGTPSIGLMQTIQPTFNAYAMSGHRNIRNPVDNIIAGLRYAISRYGRGMVRAGGRHDASGNYIGY